MSNTNTDAKAVADKAWWTGIAEASKWAAFATFPAVGASIWANKNSVFYRTKLSPSAKVATPLMIGLLFFGMRLEKSAYLLANDDKQWGFTNTVTNKEVAVKSGLPLHLQAANWAYRNPFVVIAGLGLPMAGGILNEQLKLKHLKFQQRIMASRVFAQFGVISILLLTMGFRHYMDKRGGEFVDPSGPVVDAEEPSKEPFHQQ